MSINEIGNQQKTRWVIDDQRSIIHEYSNPDRILRGHTWNTCDGEEMVQTTTE